MKNSKEAVFLIAVAMLSMFALWIGRDTLLRSIAPYLQLQNLQYLYPPMGTLSLKEHPEFEQDFQSFYPYIFRIMLSVEVRQPPSDGELEISLVGEKGEILGQNIFSHKSFEAPGEQKLNILFPKNRYEPQVLTLHVKSDFPDGDILFQLVRPNFQHRNNQLRIQQNASKIPFHANLKLYSWGKMDFTADGVIAEVFERLRRETGFLAFYFILVFGILVRIFCLGRKSPLPDAGT